MPGEVLLKPAIVFIFLIVFALAAAVLPFGPVWAAKKVDLDDVKIKGELHNDNRLRMMARESNSLGNYVKFRTNYRQDIVEELPMPEPRVKY
jgi:hypothetical protein